MNIYLKDKAFDSFSSRCNCVSTSSNTENDPYQT